MIRFEKNRDGWYSTSFNGWHAFLPRFIRRIIIKYYITKTRFNL